MKCLVFNGWAAGPETWTLCSFPRDWVFDYLEQLDGLPETVMDESDAAVLVGFSMGGSTALRLFLKNPEKVRGLVLVSATPCMMERPAWRGMSPRRLAALKLGTQMVFKNDPSPLYAEKNLDRGLTYLKTTDLRGALSAVAPEVRSRLPVRILHSAQDGVVRLHHAEFLARLFPQAKVTVVPGNEHVLPITASACVEAAVAEVLDLSERK